MLINGSEIISSDPVGCPLHVRVCVHVVQNVILRMDRFSAANGQAKCSSELLVSFQHQLTNWMSMSTYMNEFSSGGYPILPDATMLIVSRLIWISYVNMKLLCDWFDWRWWYANRIFCLPVARTHTHPLTHSHICIYATNVHNWYWIDHLKKKIIFASLFLLPHDSFIIILLDTNSSYPIRSSRSITQQHTTDNTNDTYYISVNCITKCIQSFRLTRFNWCVCRMFSSFQPNQLLSPRSLLLLFSSTEPYKRIELCFLLCMMRCIE